MNYYKFDSKQADRDFLEGKIVSCKAVIRYNENDMKRVKEGNDIVIMLSNGSKYKGKIVGFHFVVLDGHAMGDLEIRRQQKI